MVQDSVHDAFAEKLAAAVATMTVGDGSEEGVSQGPLINRAALTKVEALVGDAVQRGARVLLGGKPHALGGTFYEPTVLADATPAMRLFWEEVFGPVAPIYRFSTEAEAIRMANDTPFGLAAYVYARDVGRVWRVAEGLDYGIIGINEGIISTEVAPFGGLKESGLGREGSKYGLEDFLELKYLCLGGLDA
jgi:succinate-semialdehyde dehydrogenase/glutarate-semialdehyde dehydrogenase